MTSIPNGTTQSDHGGQEIRSIYCSENPKGSWG
jgi:hypothetical protein